MLKLNNNYNLNLQMKKIVFVLCSLLAATMANGQEVIDNFHIGPYEVDYMGKGDVNFRLRKDINLYEYFKIKKDTVVVENKKEKPIKKAFELGLSYSTPRFGVNGAFNAFGLYGSAKVKVGNGVYINYGGRMSFLYGQYNENNNCLKNKLVEVGVPLSLEFANLDRSTSSLFASIGCTPAYYSTISAKETCAGKEIDSDKKSGLYVAPKVEIGGYIPINNHLVKIGVFGEYHISCAGKEDDIFEHRTGRSFVGASIGYVF